MPHIHPERQVDNSKTYAMSQHDTLSTYDY